MQSIPQLVNDLALLLAVAAVATIVCRRFKQPLVLGYVVAGFLVSPAIGWIPNIVETADVSTWSQIGVIFLMFGLGLQFSVVKLTTVGRPALVTAVVEDVARPMAVGVRLPAFWFAGRRQPACSSAACWPSRRPASS